MTWKDEAQDPLAELRAHAILPEHQFVSHTPVLGYLIAAFRTAWNNVSARWYVQPIRQQQTQFNELCLDQFAALQTVLHQSVDQLAAMQTGLDEVRRDLAALHEWVSSQDHEQTERSHDLGALAVQLGQLRHRLDHLSASPPDVALELSTEEPAP